MLGKAIRKIRKQYKFTQSELADFCNMSITAISRIEKNESHPSINNLKIITNVLNTNIDTLMFMSIDFEKLELTHQDRVDIVNKMFPNNDK